MKNYRLPIYVDAALDDAGLTPMAFRVLGHLARRANGTGEAFPSIRSIQKICGGRLETVIAALRELELKRVIVANRKWGAKTVYKFVQRSELFTQTVPVTQTEQTVYPNGTDRLPAKTADQVSEPLEPSEGNPFKAIQEGNSHPQQSRAFALSSEAEEKPKQARKPSSFEDFALFCEQYANQKGAEPADWHHLFDKFQASGWTLKNGKHLCDWKAHTRTYINSGWHLPNGSEPKNATSRRKQSLGLQGL